MIYLSKGIAQTGGKTDSLCIEYCGQEYPLSGVQAELWQKGQFDFASASAGTETGTLETLEQLGIAEAEPGDTAAARYRILTRCVCCPAAFRKPEPPMSTLEKTVLTWLREAGLRLTVAELVYLIEHGIKPEKRLLGEENRQALVETIYTQDNIQDELLELQMENASCRDTVVDALLQLLRKKKILML